MTIRGGDGSQGTAVRARRVPRQVSQGREGECRRQRIELGRIRVIGPCEPQETGVDFAGREGSQGLQGFWTGRTGGLRGMARKIVARWNVRVRVERRQTQHPTVTQGPRLEGPSLA